jgi:hypothetical protein
MKKAVLKIIDGVATSVEVNLTPEEIAVREAEEQAAQAQNSIRNILNQITALENQQTPRRIREAMLGNQESIDFLAGIDTQISTLRNQL